MSGVLRSCAVRLIQTSSNKPLFIVQKQLPCLQQACKISGKSLRADVKRPAPYDYQNTHYSVFHAFFDKTTQRFDENSKLIVVEGPIAAGKSKFAKELADELDMFYIPQVNMDMYYINPYGYDMRQLDPKLPASFKSFDEKNFCHDPKDFRVAGFQLKLFCERFSQYIDALAHILSTGQGVVMNRCVYSDMVFMESMFKSGYISKGARSFYNEIRHQTVCELLKPHLVIYLDVPVATTKDRIKQRNLDFEIKGNKAYTDKYLNDIETIYKQQYLKDISTHAELLVYDWSNGGETEIIVEDIERINFDKYDKHDKKLKDWRQADEWSWCELRMKYGSDKPSLMNYLRLPRLDVPELVRSADDVDKFRTVWYNAPGMKYRLGYNADMGDKGLLTKTKLDLRNTL